MTIKGVNIESKLLLDISPFNKAATLAPANLKKSLNGMTKTVGGFAKTMDSQGRQISGSWWKRFGTVALGFTIAYRAMNLFETGLVRLGTVFKEAILQSGQLAEQQAKNAFWMTVFADKSLTFADAFSRAAGSINALRIESVRSISSIDELTTGIDELAQAGLPITEKLMPQMVSLIDFTAMVAQTTGSTTRQIRQELQAFMDGTLRFTNQLVRVLKNWGILTMQNLKDLKNMVNRAEIFEKVIDEVHDRWIVMVDTLLRSSPERAFGYWEKSIQKVVVEAVTLASAMRSVHNLFGETLFRAAKRFREGIDNADMNRLVYLIGLLNDGLGFLVNLFNKSVTAVATLATVSGNLARELSSVWSFLGRTAAIVLTIKALQLLGKTMRWLAVGPAKTLAKVVLFAFSPLLLALGILAVSITTVIGAVAQGFGSLESIIERISNYFKENFDFGLAIDSFMSGLDSILEDFPALGELFGDAVDPLILQGKLFVRDILNLSESFKVGFKILSDVADPYIKKISTWFDSLFKAPDMPDFQDLGAVVATEFRKMLPELILDDLKKMEREMKRFSDATPAFLNTLDALKKGLRIEDVAEFTNTQKILASYTRVLTALKAQMDLENASEFRRAEYEELRSIVEEWKKKALAHNDAKFALRLYQEQLRALKDTQDDYNNLVMTGSKYRLWALDEELKDLQALAIGNEELLILLEKYSSARRISIENEFNGLIKLAEDIAQSMENSFSDLFFDVMTLEWKNLGDLAENTLRAMQRALSDFLAQAAQAAIMGKQTGGGGWAGGFLSAFFSNWFGGGGGGGSPSPGVSPPPVGPIGFAHQGWNVGTGHIPTKMMPLSLLENAVRLHSGLRGDEYPAILQQGEKVYPRGESPIDSVTIINNTSFTPEVTETRRSGGGKDLQIIIGEMIAKDVYQGGPLNQALKVTYGLRPQTIRR